MCSNVYDDVKDFEFCGFIENAKSKYLGETFFFSNKKNNSIYAFADKLFGCVWPFCGVGAWRVNLKRTFIKTQIITTFIVSPFDLISFLLLKHKKLKSSFITSSSLLYGMFIVLKSYFWVMNMLYYIIKIYVRL